MAVIKTKTKFTKSKFTKNKYSTKKKNVSRMTKKMNVMKGGNGKPGKPGSRRRSMRRMQNSPKVPQKGIHPIYAVPNKNRQPVIHTFKSNPNPNHQYVNIAPNKAIINNNIVKNYFKGKKLNTGSRSARINIVKLQEQLEKTKNQKKSKNIILNTLSGKYEPTIVKYASDNPKMFTNLLVEEYFLGEGKKLNKGNRFARIKIDNIKTKLKNTTNLAEKKRIIFNTLSGKYEPAIVKYASENPKMFTNLLEKEATFQREMEGLYMDPQTLVFQNK